MMEKESKRPPCFKISVPGDDSKKKDVLDKLQHVRSIIVKEMNHPVNNAYILEKVLDEFISTHSLDNSETKMENMNLNTYIQVEKKDVDQQLFVTAETSLQKLLEDKVESVATHFHWAIRNCEQNPKELKDLLINVVEHYKNNHTKCHPDSRCKRDLNYEPKRSTINKPIAEKLLLGVIHKSVIFKSPDHFVLARDTSYVESFNNTMNMFQDKRIVFSDANYNTRACLAVCHWNENVDRGFTSIWNPERRNAPRSMKGKKNYKSPSYSYRNNIWKRQINSIYL
ncbi:unnamed protein product [Mytilus edulis]|uniref:Uncharacterized protein n=1 Tax=Mytilus edulis TaxID=6550 RepID=A0A8S3V0Z9_MYTED|nr:unnamed protein product [Mytilus edulis]